MCFASGLPDQSRFAAYYGQSSKYDMSADGAQISALELERFRNEAGFIAAHVDDRAGPVLDVGTATGDLLLALRDMGFSSVHGVEPSPEAARRARETHGLDVVAGDTRTAKSWNVGFALVSLVAVLEHLVDPRSALVELADLLRADGLLYLVVPDVSRFGDLIDAPYQEFSVEHINYFTSLSLRNLLATVGMEVVVERATVVKTPDADGPAIEVLCRATNDPPAIQIDRQGVDDLRAYVDCSSEKEAGVLARIDALASDQTPIYVWGTGTNALHLLAISRLAECNIVSFIDSNPHYAGQVLTGRPVKAPRDMEAAEAPILIASAISQTAIANAARSLFGPDVQLIQLY
ncbi:MAG TPA: class I SAM-dependent methyltransferase [Patescibacteria group bacterium]|nr:class I SAM-dependent methyltransferase [Patescibacteria group bacterium]